MAVTKEQADMIATLAAACRPHGAPRWDAAGIVAAVGKVRHLALADVALAVIRAAEDREARTPAVITNTRSPHWRERSMDRPRELEVLTPGERCGICARRREDCERAPRYADDNHTFEADFKTKRDGEAVRQIVSAVKAEVVPVAAPVERPSLDNLLPAQHDPRVADLRALMPAPARDQEPNT